MKTKILIQLETWYLSMNKVGAHEDLDKVRALSYKAISKAAKYENDVHMSTRDQKQGTSSVS